MENIWNRRDVPHKGWILVGLEDVGYGTHKCEMCGNEAVRYVHTVSHDEHPELRVGCVCAEKMTGDYEGPRNAERTFKNRERRFLKFSDLGSRRWKASSKGNLHTKSFPYHATLMVASNTVCLTDQTHTKWVEHADIASALRTIFEFIEGNYPIAPICNKKEQSPFEDYECYLNNIENKQA